ncbi:MAG: ABC transporter ATP-binding protein [Acidimicrobiales bacterium]|jgi:putative ABC transport system ATP-binding protein
MSAYDAELPTLTATPAEDAAPQRSPFDIECISLVHLYHLPDADVVALRGVDLDIDAGELVALLGPSGTGKSTLLRIMAGLLRPSAGQVLVGGRDVARMDAAELRRFRAVDVGIVLQDPIANLLPYATVFENIHFAAEGARSLDVTPLLSVGDLISLLGLTSCADRQVGTLSGGEQQLAALATGAAAGGRLLLIDEPTSQLDPAERDRVAAALHDLHAGSGATIVMVTHDPALAATVPRTVTIRDGRVGTEGRHGTQYAVVGRDGTIQLPPEILEVLPPDTLLRLVRHADGIELRVPVSEEGLVAEARTHTEPPS